MCPCGAAGRTPVSLLTESCQHIAKKLEDDNFR
jgi:hypothetical protein